MSPPTPPPTHTHTHTHTYTHVPHIQLRVWRTGVCGVGVWGCRCVWYRCRCVCVTPVHCAQFSVQRAARESGCRSGSHGSNAPSIVCSVRRRGETTISSSASACTLPSSSGTMAGSLATSYTDPMDMDSITHHASRTSTCTRVCAVCTACTKRQT